MRHDLKKALNPFIVQLSDSENETDVNQVMSALNAKYRRQSIRTL